jgi:hypothetical protein
MSSKSKALERSKEESFLKNERQHARLTSFRNKEHKKMIRESIKSGHSIKGKGTTNPYMVH